jgi:hypothetical protein
MTDNNSTADVLNFEGEEQKLPSGLNILTILTIIGSILSLLGGIWNYFRADKGYKDLVDMQGKLDEAPPMMKKMMGPEMVELARKTAENKLPIMLVTVIGAALCLWGALEMRKWKKQGFILWVAGEFLPVIATFIIIGTGFFSGFALIGVIFPIIFLVLYAVQRKHLKY